MQEGGHVVNAWEEGDEIIMDACRVVESRPESSPGDCKQARMLAFLNTDTSEVLIIEAKNFSLEPVARVQLPQRVPLGFHALWVPGEKLWAL